MLCTKDSFSAHALKNAESRLMAFFSIAFTSLLAHTFCFLNPASVTFHKSAAITGWNMRQCDSGNAHLAST